jgi:hypothetical protein
MPPTMITINATSKLIRITLHSSLGTKHPPEGDSIDCKVLNQLVAVFYRR